MKFVIEKYKEITIDNYELMFFEGSLKVNIRYGIDTLDFLSTMEGLGKGYIPIGDLNFVGNYLKEAYGIVTMNPIEVPEILRTERNLQRDYKILTKDELPRTGKHFLKYASKLKVYNNSLQEGTVDNLFYDGASGFLKDGLYVVSDWVNILSEYRVMVFEDNIEGVQWYSGDPSVLLNEKSLHYMVNTYMKDESRPRAYTMDLAVIQKGNERFTVILEVHPFVSVGLYGYYSDRLRLMYRDGFEYYLNINKELR